MTTKKTPVREYTNECHVKYMEIIWKNAKTATDQDGKVDIQVDLAQMQYAQRYLVSYIFDIPEEELGKMKQKDFEVLLVEANKVKDDPLVGTTIS